MTDIQQGSSIDLTLKPCAVNFYNSGFSPLTKAYSPFMAPVHPLSPARQAGQPGAAAWPFQQQAPSMPSSHVSDLVEQLVVTPQSTPHHRSNPFSSSPQTQSLSHRSSLELAASLLQQADHPLRLPQLSEDLLAPNPAQPVLNLLQASQSQPQPQHQELPHASSGQHQQRQHAQHAGVQHHPQGGAQQGRQVQDAAEGLLAFDIFNPLNASFSHQLPHSPAASHPAPQPSCHVVLQPPSATAASVLVPQPSAGSNPVRQAWGEWHQLGRDSGSREGTGADTMSASLSGLLAAALPSLLEQQSMEGPMSAQLPAMPTAYCSNCTMPLDPDPPDSPGSPRVCPSCGHDLSPQVATSCVWAQQPESARAITRGFEDALGAHGPSPPASLIDAVMGNSSDNLLTDRGDTSSISMAHAAALDSVVADAGQTLLACDDQMLLHCEPGSRPGGREHPERPQRLVSIMHELQATGLLARCTQVRGRPATDEELVAVHDPDLVRNVGLASRRLQQQQEDRASSYAMSLSGPLGEASDPSDVQQAAYDDPSRWIVDCPLNEHSSNAARVAAGTAVGVTVAVALGRARNGAAIIRPPGHHAESALSMGFCIYNNAAVAARAAQKAGAHRVLIMDWDVHHGNGTQHIFYDDPTVMYISTHRYDDGYFFPGTGSPREAGTGQGAGYNINVGWDGPGVTDADMLAAFRHIVMPMAQAFAPDMVIVSAGFDAAFGDPLGECLLSAACYGHLTKMLSNLGPTVLLLEGGYNLKATATCTAECVRVLLEDTTQPLPMAEQKPSADALSAMLQTLLVQSQFWPQAKVEMQQLLREQALQDESEGAAMGEGEDLQTSLSGMSGMGFMSEEQTSSEVGAGSPTGAEQRRFQ